MKKRTIEKGSSLSILRTSQRLIPYESLPICRWAMRMAIQFSAALCTLISGLSSMKADTIYSTYGPEPFTPNIFNHIVGWGYSPTVPSHGSGRGLATPFAFSGSPYLLTSVTLHFRKDIEGASPNLQIAVYSDDDGVPASIPLITVEPDFTIPAFYQKQSVSYDFGYPVILEPDQPYWFVVQPATVNTFSNANDASYVISTTLITPFATSLYRQYGNGWDEWHPYSDPRPPPVFRLDGTAVPEPSTWTLLGLGGALLCYAARRRRK